MGVHLYGPVRLLLAPGHFLGHSAPVRRLLYTYWHCQSSECMKKISAALREAVERRIANGHDTKYSLAKNAGVKYSVLFRWLEGNRDIRASTIDALAEYLGLELRPITQMPQRSKD